MKTFMLVVILVVISSSAMANQTYVAVAENLRGSTYVGYGPTPSIAADQSLSSCTQNSWLPGTCRVKCIRMEYLPPPCPIPMTRPYKTR